MAILLILAPLLGVRRTLGGPSIAPPRLPYGHSRIPCGGSSSQHESASSRSIPVKLRPSSQLSGSAAI
jgi:hypothetical protein